MTRGRHPSVEAIMQYFVYGHLPPHLQEISKPFGILADSLAHKLDGPELTVALRKLLESKDAAVRAAVTMKQEQA